jgi:hypothetical protein
MLTLIAAVLSPVVAALCGYVVWRLQRLHKDNNQQHESNMELLLDIRDDVKDVGRDVASLHRKVDKHHKRLSRLEQR